MKKRKKEKMKEHSWKLEVEKKYEIKTGEF